VDAADTGRYGPPVSEGAVEDDQLAFEDGDVAEVTESTETASATPIERSSLNDVLRRMKTTYDADPVKAVRGQSFIKMLHRYIADDLRSRLTDVAVKQGVLVKEEAKLFGSHKPKDADVAVIHPNNGALMSIGVRSQMTSLGNNVLEYYQGIIGECISLQDRFPMAVYGYVYLHPEDFIKKVKRKVDGVKTKVDVEVTTDYARYARMYAAIAGRDGTQYKDIRGIYDHFAYMVVDFDESAEDLVRDDLVQRAVPISERDMRISTFVDRLVATFKKRNLWLDYFE
jgi:hypothetical protein